VQTDWKTIIVGAILTNRWSYRQEKINKETSLCTKINSKWTKELNVTFETTIGKNRENTARHRHRQNF
jgi:hypothetical protein